MICVVLFNEDDEGQGVEGGLEGREGREGRGNRPSITSSPSLLKRAEEIILLQHISAPYQKSY